MFIQSLSKRNVAIHIHSYVKQVWTDISADNFSRLLDYLTLMCLLVFSGIFPTLKGHNCF